MNRFKVALVAGLASAISSMANAGLIVDFEDVVLSGVSTAAGVQTSQGFSFAPTATTNDLVRVQQGAGTCSGGCVDNGTQRLTLFNNDATAPFEVVMSAMNGLPFALLSFDFTENFIFTTDTGANITLTGTLEGGGTAIESFEIDQIENTFQTASVTRMVDVTSILIASDRYFPAFDNFVVSVPEPATLAIISLGFAGLGYSRRKKG